MVIVLVFVGLFSVFLNNLKPQNTTEENVYIYQAANTQMVRMLDDRALVPVSLKSGRLGDHAIQLVEGSRARFSLKRDWLISVSVQSVSLLREYRYQLRAAIERYCFNWRTQNAAMFKAMTIGDRPSSWSRLSKIFKSLGLYHLLVISGFHVAFASRLLVWSTLLPISFFAALVGGRFYFAEIAIRARPLLAIVVANLVMFMVGCGAPAQRAAFVFSLKAIGDSWSFKIAFPILIACSLQMLLFPESFLSISNGLSWTAFLIVRKRHALNKELGFFAKVVGDFKMMVVLTCAVTAWISIVNPISPLINLLLVLVLPTFVLLLTSLFLSIQIGIIEMSDLQNLQGIWLFLDKVVQALSEQGLGPTVVQDCYPRFLSALIVVLWLRR